MKRISRTTLCALCVLCGEVAIAHEATLAPGGVVRIAAGGRDYAVEPLAFFPGWVRARRSGGHEVSPDGAVSLRLTDGSRPLLDLSVTLRQLDGGKAELYYAFNALEDIATLSLGCELKLPAGEADGHLWQIGEKTGSFAPPADGGLHLASGTASSFAFDLGASGERLCLRVSQGGASPPSVDCLVQDNARWSPEYHVRLGSLVERRLARGETISLALTLSLSSGEPLVVKTAMPYVIEAGDEWIPLEYRRDIMAGSALDFSNVCPADAPAGKHGWLRNVDGHFEFENLPGAPQRFYGVNLSHSANYPNHDLADALVKRLRRLGYNAVRIHHHDGAWAKAYEGRGNSGRGISTKCPQNEGGRIVDASLPQSDDDIDRLDYFLAKCFENGIYATTDLYVSRSVPWRDIGVDQDGMVPMHVFKMLCAVWEPAFENWAQFAESFLLHENPYTGRRYIDEPAMPLISLINEGAFFVGWYRGNGRDDPRVLASWREWLTARRKADPTFAPDLTTDATPRVFWEGEVHPAVAQWTGELEARMVARMKSRLRAIGCRALVTNDNCGPHYAALQRATADYDYIDDHFYVDHPRFPETAWRLPATCQNENPLLGGGHLAPSEQAFTRMLRKPFTISEWNFAAPGRYRGMGGILAGAMAALQGWDGMWRFAYSHTRDNIGDCDIRTAGFFDLAADPLAQAAERAALCLFRRGDLATLTNGVALWCTLESAAAQGKTFMGFPPWSDAAWTMRVGSCLDPEAANGLRVIRREEAESQEQSGRDISTKCPQGDGGRFVEASLPGESLSLDRERGTFAVVTPRTCGGFAESGRLEAGPLSFEIGEGQRSNVRKMTSDNRQPTAGDLSTFQPSNISTDRCGDSAATTIWVSSLDGEPIERSSRLLLTHLTDVQGEGTRFADDTMTTLLAWGGRPLVRAGAADVELRLDGGAGASPPSVWSLDTAGRRVGEIPSRIEDGVLRFRVSTCGPNGGCICYEMAR